RRRSPPGTVQDPPGQSRGRHLENRRRREEEARRQRSPPGRDRARSAKPGRRALRARERCRRAAEAELSAAAVARVGELTDAAAARWRDREALVFRDRRYTFGEIAAEVDRAARGLIHAGVEPGDKVALWLLNGPEWIFAMFALAKIGAVHVPI